VNCENYVSLKYVSDICSSPYCLVVITFALMAQHFHPAIVEANLEWFKVEALTVLKKIVQTDFTFEFDAGALTINNTKVPEFWIRLVYDFEKFPSGQKEVCLECKGRIERMKIYENETVSWTPLKFNTTRDSPYSELSLKKKDADIYIYTYQASTSEGVCICSNVGQTLFVKITRDMFFNTFEFNFYHEDFPEFKLKFKYHATNFMKR